MVVAFLKIGFTPCGRQQQKRNVSKQTSPPNIENTYRLPLGVHSLLVELGHLAPVLDGGEQLPDEQEGDADQHDAHDHADHDRQEVDRLGAVFGVLCDHIDRLFLLVVLVLEVEGAIVLVPHEAHLLVVLRLAQLHRADRIDGAVVTLLLAQRARLVDATLDAVAVQVALLLAIETLLAVHARHVLVALALAAPTLPVARTYLAVLHALRFALLAAAIVARPAVLALAPAAHTGAVVGARTHLAIEAVAAEVVALAKFARNLLLRVALEALALAAALGKKSKQTQSM